MDPLTAISLAGTIVQFVDFTTKFVSKSTELYRSGSGVLAENANIEKTTADLKKLNHRLEQTAAAHEPDLQTLCQACGEVADQLLNALAKLRVTGQGQKWQSLRKALRSIWSKADITQLEQRLASFRSELNLRIVIGMRYVLIVNVGVCLTFSVSRVEISQFKQQHADQLRKLDSVEKSIIDAIIQQKDVFIALHDAQNNVIIQLHDSTQGTIQQQHEQTRELVIRESAKFQSISKQRIKNMLKTNSLYRL
jgi:hypothetical protein